MIRTLVSVYDIVAKVYGPPLAFINSGEGCRWFSDMVKGGEQGGNIAKHPGDFMLFQIGTFDDVSGVAEALMPPNRLGIGSDYGPASAKVDVDAIIRNQKLEESLNGR